MTDTDSLGCGPLGEFIRAFYDARRTAARTGDLSLLHSFIAADVRWSEPDVGAHMGVLEGRDAVLDMIRRPHYVKATVRVHEYPDGTLALFHGPRCLARYQADGEPIDTPNRQAA